MRHTHVTTYNNRPVMVAMGWDEPLQGYFMTIEPMNNSNPDADSDSGMIYSNLDDKKIPDPTGMTPDIELYKKRLRRMKIEVPAEFFSKVLAD